MYVEHAKDALIVKGIGGTSIDRFSGFNTPKEAIMKNVEGDGVEQTIGIQHKILSQFYSRLSQLCYDKII